MLVFFLFVCGFLSLHAHLQLLRDISSINVQCCMGRLVIPFLNLLSPFHTYMHTHTHTHSTLKKDLNCQNASLQRKEMKLYIHSKYINTSYICVAIDCPT